MWRRSGRIEDRARARVDSKAGEAQGRRCGARGEHLLVQAVPAKLRSIRDGSRRDALQQGSRSEGPGGCMNPRTKSSGEQFRSPNPTSNLLSPGRALRVHDDQHILGRPVIFR